MPLMERIARNVRRHREARGWTQQELARRLRVHRVYVAQIETATRGVSVKILEQLGKVFRVKPGRFLD
jgi:transcriptional regulator with XRE-family HTH domain